MEFKQVIGDRRSIRFFDPDKPVPRDKIQKMLEAARLASCAVNAQWARAVVGFRDDLTEDQLNRLKTPVAGLNTEMAPVHIHFFLDAGVVQRNEGRPLKELVDVGALAPTHGWSHKFVDEFVYPQILKPMTMAETIYHRTAAFDVGVAVCQALLTGVDEGLGVGLVTLNGARTQGGLQDAEGLDRHLDDPRRLSGRRPRRAAASAPARRSRTCTSSASTASRSPATRRSSKN